jgi:hypothetical protein
LADKSIPLDASGSKALKLVDNGDDTYSYAMEIPSASFTEDNKLEVSASIDITSVTATDVTIHDATTTDNKLAIAEDGSISVVESALETKIDELNTKIDAIIAGTSQAAVTCYGSKMEYYGATVADRPDADAVLTGAIFKAIDSDEFWQSNGTSWVVLV